MADETKVGDGSGSVDLATVAAGLVAKSNGDHSKVVMRLLKENYGYRRQIEDVRGKAPAEGDLVLKGDDAKAWVAYREINADPKALKKLLAEGATASNELSSLKISQSYRDAATHETLKFKPGAFERLAKQDGLKIEVREAELGGKKVETPCVVGEDGKVTPVKVYAETNWGDFLPSLTEAKPARAPGTPPRPDDTPLPPRPGEGDDGRTIENSLRLTGAYQM